MGEVLIAGTASLLICIFLSPQFIEFLRERLTGKGYELQIFDSNVAHSRLIGANKAFLDERLPHISQVLTDDDTTLRGDANHVSIATYNLENLDRTDGKYDLLPSNTDLIAAEMQVVR